MVQTPRSIFPWARSSRIWTRPPPDLFLVAALVVLSIPHTMNARPHKQSMSELKLRRLTEHNQRLREDLARPRMRVSEASARYRPSLLFRASCSPTPHSLIRYCKTTKDHLVRRACISPRSAPHHSYRFRQSGVLSGRARIHMHHHKRVVIAL